MYLDPVRAVSVHYQAVGALVLYGARKAPRPAACNPVIAPAFKIEVRESAVETLV
jgi:hypothetical protein